MINSINHVKYFVQLGRLNCFVIIYKSVHWYHFKFRIQNLGRGYWMWKCVPRNTLYQFIAIFPGVSQNWANFLSMDPHWVNTLPVRLFYLLWSEFPRYHIIINFSIIQSRGAEPTCNLGENREVCVRGYIVYNFAIWKIYSNVPGTVHVLPNFVIPVLLQTCWGFNRTAGGPAFVWSGPIV